MVASFIGDCVFWSQDAPGKMTGRTGAWRVELEVVMGIGWRTGYSGDLWGSVQQAQLGAAGDAQQECPP